MSKLTAKLLGCQTRTRSAWVGRLDRIADAVVKLHGVPSLGNFDQVDKEILYIVLSARTSEVLYQTAHRQLFEKHPTIKDISNAPMRSIRRCVEIAGLGLKRSRQVKAIAKRLNSDFGDKFETAIRAMDYQQAFDYLTSLPGVGSKSALCVMMFSLRMDVFPVDVNVQRIAERLGVIQSGLKHFQAQKALPKYVPAGRSKELHIGLLVHGRKVCLPRRPLCDKCELADLCRTGKRNKKNE